MPTKNKKQKRSQPTHTQWTIKEFPVRLRLRFAAHVKIKQTTIPAQLEEIVKAFLELPEKNKLPAPTPSATE